MNNKRSAVRQSRPAEKLKDFFALMEPPTILTKRKPSIDNLVFTISPTPKGAMLDKPPVLPISAQQKNI